MLLQVPFGQTPSLHPLRRRCFGFVRGLLGYYGPVRLPVFVHHRLLSLDFPIRPECVGSRANAGPPGFRARCVPACQGLRPRGSPSHLAWAMLRMLPSAWHHGVGVPESRMFRGSMPWPALPPVNASALPLQAAPHDSGPVWFATPSLCDSFIHYIPPAFTGARRPTLCGEAGSCFFRLCRKGWARMTVASHRNLRANR